MQCPKCGNDMAERNGFFGIFYSCQFCGATANPPNTPSFNVRFQKAVDSYCRICGEYRRLVDHSIFLGMNPEQGLSLLHDCEKKFTNDANDYLRPMDKTLRKPAFMDARKVMNSETALVFARFAEACVQLNQYKEAKRFIDHALNLADPLDENYKEIFATQSEIITHLNAIETSTSSETLLLASSNASPETNEQIQSSASSENEMELSGDKSQENQPLHQESRDGENLIARHETATNAPFFSTLGMLSTYGRRRRVPYICVVFSSQIAFFAFSAIFQTSFIMIFLFLLLLCWIAITNVFKRVHDLDHPDIIAKLYITLFISNHILGVLFLIAPKLEIFHSSFVVILYIIFAIFNLYLFWKSGTKGANQYGASPEELKNHQKLEYTS